jgi:Na+/H+ antiporter NhaD/arsenite permease-like protein
MRSIWAFVFMCVSLAAQAGEINGAGLTFIWALPFVGLLLCIATGPVLYAHFWEHHYGKIALFWALCVAIPLALSFGWGQAAKTLMHTLVFEYMSFIILLFALFSVAGGIVIKGNIHGAPLTNTRLFCWHNGSFNYHDTPLVACQ